MLKTMIDTYNEFSYTHWYFFGVVFARKVWLVKVDSSILPYVLKLDKASRGKGYSLRFKPNNKIRAMLLVCGAEPICSVEYFNTLVAESKYNKGEVFEKLVTEYFGQTWEKDSVPFTDDGDLTVDGIAYQIKFESATFLTEAQMVRLRAGE